MERFTTKVITGQSSKFTYIITPFNAAEKFDIHDDTIYVKGTIDGVKYKGKLLSRWDGRQVLLLDKNVQRELKLDGSPLDVEVEMQLDCKIDVENKVEVELLTGEMDVLSAIRGRRSIRSFTDGDVSEEQVNTILQAGMCAPTAKNRKPYHFVVIRDRDKLKTLSEANRYRKMLAQAPLAIVVCGDKEIEDKNEYLHADCAAATQNILLAVHGLELGATWCGVRLYNEWHNVLEEQLELPDKVIPFSVIAIGHPAEEKYPYKSLYTDKIHYDKW